MRFFFNKYAKYIFLTLLLYIPLFLYLDALAIRVYDEARLAVNAIEMYKNGDFLVTHFRNEPDMWNTKPPLLIWLQVISMHIFGVNEWAIRIPSFLAALGTCIALVKFSEKYLKTFWFGFAAVMILVTMNGYISYHAARTGDYDSLLTLCTTLSGLFLFVYVENKKNKYLYLFFLFLILGCLTKGVAGLLFGPAYLIYIIYKKEFLNFLKNKHFYFGLVAFVLVIGSYYILRERINPGYLEAVQANELGGRFIHEMTTHKKEFLYYLRSFKNYDFSYWLLLIPCGLLTGFVSKNEKIKKITIYSFILVFMHLLLLSVATNKLHWYTLPEFPFFAIIIAVFVYTIFLYLKNLKIELLSVNKNIFPYIFLLLIIGPPYLKMSDKIYNHKKQNSKFERNYELAYYMRNALNNPKDVSGYKILNKGYNTHNLFYLKALQLKGIDVSFKYWGKLEAGDSVITYQQRIKNFIRQNYNYTIIGEKGNIVKYKIDSRKK